MWVTMVRCMVMRLGVVVVLLFGLLVVLVRLVVVYYFELMVGVVCGVIGFMVWWMVVVW